MLNTAPQTHSADVQYHPIVVVGAGLAGLTLVCSLARWGVQSILLEAAPGLAGPDSASRAISYTQKTLEIFQQLGLIDQVMKNGVQWHVGRTFSGSKEIYNVDQRHQHSGNFSSQPAYVNLQQFDVERYLVGQLAHLKHGQIRWQSRVLSYQEGEKFAELTVQTPDGTILVQTDHVIDATGQNSPFHAWCQTQQVVIGAQHGWAMADVRFKIAQPPERRSWIDAPFNEHRAAWQSPLPDGVWRFDWQLKDGEQVPFTPTSEYARTRLEKQFGNKLEYDILWSGAYSYRSQCLEQLRVGRVFFIGDAAKIIAPHGSRSANMGVADAFNLAWKLAAVLRQRAPNSLLDSYHDERHEAALQNIRISQRTARFLSPANRSENLLRQAAISLAKPYTFARQFMNTGRMAQASNYHHSPLCSASGGPSAPNVKFLWADNSTGVLNDLLQWADGNLLVLVFGDLSAAACQRLIQIASHTPARCVQVVGAHSSPQAFEHVRDPLGHLQGACHVFGHAWALLRPDSYLAATGEAVDADLLDAIELSLSISH